MNLSPPTATVREALFAGPCHGLRARTDRMFAALMLMQWVAGLMAALLISSGRDAWAVLVLGSLITGFPVALAWLRPGWWFTRHTIAVAQMLASALLIHLTGGRIESHFHIFGSLAFLACYRDCRVLLTATVAVAVDHFFRGVYWPGSVYGALTAGPWRTVEHIGWVLLCDAVLIISIEQSLRDMAGVTAQQDRLADSYHHLEAVKQELLATNIILNSEIERRIQREEETQKLHHELVATSRRAGMADVASSVLHNVGNVLNSVNISSNLIATMLRWSSICDMGRIAGMLRAHEADLHAYLTSDPKGRRIPAYFLLLADALESERVKSLVELESLMANVDHIKQIIAMQQGIACSGGVLGPVVLSELFGHALSINLASLDRHEIEVVREFADLPALVADRHQVLQVLVNLISNAKSAMLVAGSPVKRLTVRAQADPVAPEFVLLQVSDTGMGIKPEHLPRLFTQGFTTKLDGHGFGLHSSALAAKAMGGVLEVRSDGEGLGTTFTLRLPAPIQKLQAAA